MPCHGVKLRSQVWAQTAEVSHGNFQQGPLGKVPGISVSSLSQVVSGCHIRGWRGGSKDCSPQGHSSILQGPLGTALVTPDTTFPDMSPPQNRLQTNDHQELHWGGPAPNAPQIRICVYQPAGYSINGPHRVLGLGLRNL